jgi:hypothetical protein
MLAGKNKHLKKREKCKCHLVTRRWSCNPWVMRKEAMNMQNAHSAHDCSRKGNIPMYGTWTKTGIERHYPVYPMCSKNLNKLGNVRMAINYGTSPKFVLCGIACLAGSWRYHGEFPTRLRGWSGIHHAGVPRIGIPHSVTSTRRNVCRSSRSVRYCCPTLTRW